jgi:hypothetical protein
LTVAGGNKLSTAMLIIVTEARSRQVDGGETLFGSLALGPVRWRSDNPCDRRFLPRSVEQRERAETFVPLETQQTATIHRPSSQNMALQETMPCQRIPIPETTYLGQVMGK